MMVAEVFAFASFINIELKKNIFLCDNYTNKPQIGNTLGDSIRA
jgi:hypothetical protein